MKWSKVLDIKGKCMETHGIKEWSKILGDARLNYVSFKRKK